MLDELERRRRGAKTGFGHFGTGAIMPENTTTHRTPHWWYKRGMDNINNHIHSLKPVKRNKVTEIESSPKDILKARQTADQYVCRPTGVELRGSISGVSGFSNVNFYPCGFKLGYLSLVWRWRDTVSIGHCR